MTDRHDPFELLRQTDPVDPATIPGPDSDTGRALFAAIVTQPRNPRRLHMGTRRRLVAVIAVIAVAGAAAATWLTSRRVAEPTDVVCYQGATLDSDRAVITDGGPLDPAVCATVWEDGTLTNTAIVPPHTVPPFVACVLDTGPMGVFPSTDPNLCDRLGLATIDPATLPQAERIRTLNEEINTYFTNRTCVTFDNARQAITDAITRSHLTGWHIQQTAAPSPQRPCASYSIEATTKTIYLIPIIPNPDQPPQP